MRKTIIIAALVLLWTGAANAMEETVLCGTSLPACCEITCIMLDADCNPCCRSDEPLTVEFLDRDAVVLGTAVIPAGWCCCEEMVAKLDQAVNSSMVCSVRLRKADGDCKCFWMSLRVFCTGYCEGGDWHMVFKDDVWYWTAVEEEVVTE